MSNHPARRPWHKIPLPNRSRPQFTRRASGSRRRAAKAINRRYWVHEMTHTFVYEPKCGFCVTEANHFAGKEA